MMALAHGLLYGLAGILVTLAVLAAARVGHRKPLLKAGAVLLLVLAFVAVLLMTNVRTHRHRQALAIPIASQWARVANEATEAAIDITDRAMAIKNRALKVARNAADTGRSERITHTERSRQTILNDAPDRAEGDAVGRPAPAAGPDVEIVVTARARTPRQRNLLKSVRGTWIENMLIAAAVGALLLIGYIFLDASTRGQFTWSLRILTVVAFFLVLAAVVTVRF